MCYFEWVVCRGVFAAHETFHTTFSSILEAEFCSASSTQFIFRDLHHAETETGKREFYITKSICIMAPSVKG